MRKRPTNARSPSAGRKAVGESNLTLHPTQPITQRQPITFLVPLQEHLSNGQTRNISSTCTISRPTNQETTPPVTPRHGRGLVRCGRGLRADCPWTAEAASHEKMGNTTWEETAQKWPTCALPVVINQPRECIANPDSVPAV